MVLLEDELAADYIAKQGEFMPLFFVGQDQENDIVAEGAAFVHGDPPQDANGPPKVDSAVEILHEKVTKQIIKEGHGQKPSKYSTCFCKYQISACIGYL